MFIGREHHLPVVLATAAWQAPEVVAVGIRHRPKRRTRQLIGFHPRTRRRPIPSSEPAKPPTWRAWKAKTGQRWWCYPLAIEWALEWFVYRLRRLALFDLLELAGRATVLVAVLIWFLEADQRARQAEEAIKERHYRAWELINAARGSTGDGGRRDALQDLNRDRVPMAAAPLEKAWLPGVDLQSANLQGTFLRNANLQGANLVGANLQDADLRYANLQSAVLWGTHLQRADLGYANLQSAVLWGTHLQRADLGYANLQGTFLRNANLQGATLAFADLQGVYMWSTDLQGANLLMADLRGANLESALNLTQEQLDAAGGNDKIKLPPGFTRPAHWSDLKNNGQPKWTFR